MGLKAHYPHPAAAAERQFRVALVQHASQSVLEEGVRGVIEALAARGYSDGGRMRLNYVSTAFLPLSDPQGNQRDVVILRRCRAIGRGHCQKCIT